MRKTITDFWKKSFIILMITLLISVPFQVFAADDPVWTSVGPAGFSSGSAYNIALALNGSGQPCVFFADNANGNRATVMHYNGSAWVPVGPVGFSPGAVQFLFLAIDSQDTLYVAFQDGASGNKATVMRFDGTAWVPVGVRASAAAPPVLPRWILIVPTRHTWLTRMVPTAIP